GRLGGGSGMRCAPPAVRSSPMRSRRPSRWAAASAADASSRLETLGNADPLERVGAVRPWHLAAEPRRRDHLARIADAERVERAAEPLEDVEVALGKHAGHRARLVHADAVLARERAAGVQACVEDRLRELARALGLSGPRVVQDKRMEVAVTGMEDVADAEAVCGRQLLDA